MSLHGELLEQAEHLAIREPIRPRQASLRRAISAAYYAMFQLLIAEASGIVLSGTGLRSLRPRLSRAFVHKEMKTVSRAFVGGVGAPKLPPEIAKMLDETGDSIASLKEVANTFVVLQQRRHEADYNSGGQFDRSEVLIVVESAKNAFQVWKRIRKTPVARAYLLALLVSNRWDRA